MEGNNIKTEIKALFSRMGKQEGMFEALYRSVASSFGISTCEMWIYYFLLIEQDRFSLNQRYSACMFNYISHSGFTLSSIKSVLFFSIPIRSSIFDLSIRSFGS
jgi:hypothetical protein